LCHVLFLLEPTDNLLISGWILASEIGSCRLLVGCHRTGLYGQLTGQGSQGKTTASVPTHTNGGVSQSASIVSLTGRINRLNNATTGIQQYEAATNRCS
jgi:hypothetical protein